MSNGIEEEPTPVDIHEYAVLEKFEGEETTPEALVERIHIENGEIIKREYWENGEMTSSENVKEVT